GWGVSTWQRVCGRRLARQDSRISCAAIFRERVPVRPASMDLGGGNELGIHGYRANSPRRQAESEIGKKTLTTPPSQGSASATYSAVWSLAPMPTTMYCLPLNR